MHTTNHRGFWQEINRLGPPKRACQSFDAVKLENGLLSTDSNTIKAKWLTDYSSLYQESSSLVFDNVFLDCVKRELPLREKNNVELDPRIGIPLVDTALSLNAPIKIEEIQSCVKLIKLGKAVGTDNVANEILRRPELLTFFHSIFSKCFQFGTIKKEW
jgi:hypothetical protein